MGYPQGFRMQTVADLMTLLNLAKINKQVVIFNFSGKPLKYTDKEWTVIEA